ERPLGPAAAQKSVIEIHGTSSPVVPTLCCSHTNMASLRHLDVRELLSVVASSPPQTAEPQVQSRRPAPGAKSSLPSKELRKSLTMLARVLDAAAACGIRNGFWRAALGMGLCQLLATSSAGAQPAMVEQDDPTRPVTTFDVRIHFENNATAG